MRETFNQCFSAFGASHVRKTCAVGAFFCAHSRRFVPLAAQKTRENQLQSTMPPHKQAIESLTLPTIRGRSEELA
jgi:hypothetical protein